MLVDSNLLQDLERNAFFPTGQPMSVYGNPAYPLRAHLQAPFRHGILIPMMEQYNFDMSSVRVTVEWLFGDIINDFKFLDFKKNAKNWNELCLYILYVQYLIMLLPAYMETKPQSFFWSRPSFIAVLF